MTREEYLNYRIEDDYKNIVVEYYKDIDVFKKDADYGRMLQFLSIISRLVPLDVEDMKAHFDRKFHIVYVIGKHGQLIDIR